MMPEPLWVGILVFIGILALFAIKRPLLQWAEAHHARKAAQREDNDHDDRPLPGQ